MYETLGIDDEEEDPCSTDSESEDEDYDPKEPSQKETKVSKWDLATMKRIKAYHDSGMTYKKIRHNHYKSLQRWEFRR